MQCIIHSYDFKLCLIDSFSIEQHMQRNAKNISQNIFNYFLKNADEFNTLSKNGYIVPLSDIEPGAFQLFTLINNSLHVPAPWKVLKKYERYFNLEVLPDSSIWLLAGNHLKDWSFNYSKHHDELTQYIDSQKVCSGKKIKLPPGKYSVSIILLQKQTENNLTEQGLLLQFDQIDIGKICNDIMAFNLKHKAN